MVCNKGETYQKEADNITDSSHSSPRKKIYRTAREEFFKDLMHDSSSERKFSNQNEHAISPNGYNSGVNQEPKVRVAGQTLPTRSNHHDTNHKPFSSIGTLTKYPTPNNKLPNVQMFSHILNNALCNDLPSSSMNYNDYLYDDCNTTGFNTGYNSLKRKKQLQTANLPTLLR